MDGAVGHRETPNSRAPSRAGATSAHSHRFHHVRCNSSSSATPQASSFLHERIQQRRAEKGLSERNITISTGGSRDRDGLAGSSPARWSSTGTVRRARSNSDEHEVNGMGIKETERTIETLKKQNWDFKLELYHRRERQTALEEEMKLLQDEHATMLAQNTETMKLYDDLVQELDRRDKALFEAIDMIVDLQATVEGLESGNATPRNIQTGFQGNFKRGQINSPAQAATPTIHGPGSPRLASSTEVPGPGDDWKTLERMSSFLQEHGERTPNLREMVLNNKRSFLHMRKISEASAVPSEMHRNASPSLSVLSESSFLSVYGSSNRTPDQIPSLPELRDPVSAKRAGNQGLATDNSSRPTTSIQRKLTPPTPAISRIKIRTKQEKREALRNVITSSPNAHDFAHARMLPPTPDTTTSSVLRRYQNSDDTLSGERRTTPPDNTTNEAKGLPSKLSSNVTRGNSLQPTPAPVTTVRKDLLGPRIGYSAPTNNRSLDRTQPQRPQSACETTRSRQRNSVELDSDSDSDSEGGADAYSKASELDYWMRESTKPNIKTADSRGVSPDLFSFPNESGRWDTDAIFGAMRGAGFMGSPAPDLKRDPVDEVSGALIAPENGILEPFDPEARDGGIPAPARRSSRHARTRSISSSTASPESLQARRDAIKAKAAMQMMGGTRRNSIASANIRVPFGPQADYQADGAGGAKRGQYPPIVGQPTKQRKPGALNRLFRRSIGGYQDIQVMPSAESRPQSEQVQQEHPQLRRDVQTGMKNVPRPSSALCWRAPTTFLQDELTSATPPPILRKRAHFADGTADGGQGANGEQQYTDAPSNTNTPGGGRRKWLSLGNRNSLMSRNA